MRFYGMEKDRDEIWEDTERKVKDYIGKDLGTADTMISIDMVHGFKGLKSLFRLLLNLSSSNKEKILKIFTRQKRKESNDKMEIEKTQNGNGDGDEEDTDI